MYAKFNTPILKSNNFINANIYGNIICNSDPSLSNEDIYTLSSDETISTLHSSCIIDVYEDNNVSLLEPYKININNNIFTDSNPKGILISTENIKRETMVLYGKCIVWVKMDIYSISFYVFKKY